MGRKILEFKWSVKMEYDDTDSDIALFQPVMAMISALPRAIGNMPNQLPNRQEGKLRTLAEAEKFVIERSLLECGGNISAAAAAIGITRATFYDKMKLYGISKERVNIARALKEYRENGEG